MSSHLILSKTGILNSIRKAFTNRVAEALLLELTSGRKPNSLPAKLIPMPNLYPSPSIRNVTRKGIHYELDISDLVDWYIYFSILDEGLEALFSLINKGDTVLDIGANIGHTVLRAAQIASGGMAVGFEPTQHNYRKCLKNISLNPNLATNIKIENLALGETHFQSFITVRDGHNRGMNRVDAQIENA